MLFILSNRVFNHFGIHIRAIGLGIDSCKNDSVICFEVVDNAIAATFAFLHTAIFEPNFEDGVADPRDAIVWQVPATESAAVVPTRLGVEGDDGRCRGDGNRAP